MTSSAAQPMPQHSSSGFWPFVLTHVSGEAWEYRTPPDASRPNQYRKMIIRPEKVLLLTNDPAWYEAVGGNANHCLPGGVAQLKLEGPYIDPEEVRCRAAESGLLLLYPRTPNFLSSHISTLPPAQRSASLTLSSDEGLTLQFVRTHLRAQLTLGGLRSILEPTELLSLLSGYAGLLPSGQFNCLHFSLKSVQGEIKVHFAHGESARLHLPLSDVRKSRVLSFLSTLPEGLP